MDNKLPLFLKEKLIKYYGMDSSGEIIDGYNKKRKTTFRVNTLKTNAECIKEILDKEKLTYKEVLWNRDMFIIENITEEDIKKLEIYEKGAIYLQSLSSAIPAVVLDPKPNENILDMAAAPGGKTTQMLAISNNEAMITACEKNKIRAEKLQYNIKKQGATRVNIILKDARKLDDYFLFDKILLDSPCSGSGTDTVFRKDFTEELVKRSEKIQEELLKKAIKILKSGGEIVYSTCSILKSENEDIIEKVLKSEKVEVVPIEKERFKRCSFIKYQDRWYFMHCSK